MAVVTLAGLYLAATPITTDPITYILGAGGIMGAVFLLTAFGKGVHSDDAWQERGRRMVEKDQIIAQQTEIIRRLQDGTQHVVLPALARNADVLEAIPVQGAGTLAEIRQIEARMVDLVAQIEAATINQQRQQP